MLINLLLIALLTAINIYFIKNRNPAILAFLILIQEVYLLPFTNLGIQIVGHVYYSFFVLLYVVFVAKLKINLTRVSWLSVNPINIAFGLVMVGVFFHLMIVGLPSSESHNLINRLLTQVFPVILVIIFFVDQKDLIKWIPIGVIVYGLALYLILFTTTDIFNITSYARRNVRDDIGLSPIALSRFSGLLIISTVIMMLDDYYKKYRYLFIPILFIGVVFLVLGMSRGPLIAIMVSLLFYIIFQPVNIVAKARNLFYLFIPIILFFGILIFVFNFGAAEVYISRIEGLENFEDMRRFRRIELALSFIFNSNNINLETLIFGLGPGGFANEFNLGYAHNFFIESVMEYGLLGLISFFILLITGTYISIRIIVSDGPRMYTVLPLMWVFLFVCFMFSGDLIARRNLYFMSYLLVGQYYYLRREEVNNTELTSA